MVAAAAIPLLSLGANLLMGNRAQQQAAEQQAAASRANIDFIRQQGALGQQRLQDAEQAARQVAMGIPQEAIAPIQPFQQAGAQAFGLGQQRILGGQFGGGIADAVSQAAMGSIPGGLDPRIAAALGQEASFTGQRVAPQVNQALLGLGRIGLGAAGDVAGIQTRGFNRLGDIARGSGVNQANVLLGQAPQIAQQITDAATARGLGQIGQRQNLVDLTGQLSFLAGRNL